MPAGRRRHSQATWWGFHRLTDDWARHLVAAADIQRGDLVLDVGAGTGALTAPLVTAGARVIAVELHARRADALARRFTGAPVRVLRVDAADLWLPRRPFRVVANPPFGTTTALLRRLLAAGSNLVTADLVVPRHVARRWTGAGASGVHRWGRTFTAEIAGPVPRRAFRPSPPADAVVLRLERRAERARARPRPSGDGKVRRARRRTRGG